MAGAGYKLFNTGDVLTAAQVNTYLMEQSVMVFANAAARTTALSGVVAEGMLSYLKDTDAVEVYNGSAWVASDDPNAIQNTIVDAKGDLIAASANDTPARLAVGNNGETLLADSTQTTGLRWQEPISVNACINGGMDIWARGTSFSIGTSTTTYTADRFLSYRSSAVAGMTVARSTDAPTGFTYSAKIQRDSGNTGTQNLNFRQAFESQQSKQFAGKTVVVSFYAKAGANYSPTSSNLSATLISGTGTDESAITMGSWTGVATTASTISLTTSWVRYSFTAAVASTSNQLGITFACTPVGTAGADDSYYITGIQLENGSVATPFRRAGGTLAGELAACQRYYNKIIGSNAYTNFGFGYASTTTNGAIFYSLPVNLRTVPSSVDYSTVQLAYGGSTYAVSAVALDGFAGGPQTTLINVTTTGLTGGQFVYLRGNNSATAYVAFNAEL